MIVSGNLQHPVIDKYPTCRESSVLQSYLQEDVAKNGHDGAEEKGHLQFGEGLDSKKFFHETERRIDMLLRDTSGSGLLFSSGVISAFHSFYKGLKQPVHL